MERRPLDLFSEEEARAYLTRRGITNNEQVIAVILKLSSRLPLLLATLAASAPDDPAQVGDASGTAVERFLKWTADLARRALALDAALPRRLNRDIVRLLADAPDFDWLITNPFVHRLPDGGWAYHQVVREQMLRYKRADSPDGWTQLHERLADHHRAARDALGLSDADGRRDADWRAAALEEQYHRLCARPQARLGGALNGFAQWLDVGLNPAGDWAAMLTAAGRDTDHAALQEWGETLERGVEAYRSSEDDQNEIAIGVFTRLLDSDLLEPANQAVILSRRGESYHRMEHYEDALISLDLAIKINPKYAWAIATRGLTYFALGHYEDALVNLDLAIEITPKNDWAITSRGETYRMMGRYDDALTDLDYAIQLNPEYDRSFASRGEVYRLTERYDEALADFDRAIELNPEYAWIIAKRGEIYLLLERYEEALADFNRATKLDPKYAWAIAKRGEAYRRMGRGEEALADFDRAIELDPRYALVIPLWDGAYGAGPTVDYKEALTDLNRAIKFNPESVGAITLRGVTYGLLGRYEEALTDFNRVIELSPEDSETMGTRGLTYRQIGRYEKALADFDRAIELSPDDNVTIALRGETYQQIEHYEEAIADFTRALELDPKEGWYYYQRALTIKRFVPTGPWQEDLDTAITRATEEYQTTPTNLPNLFNLALYHTARGDAGPAEARYREALALPPNAAIHRAAITDLEQYLALFPDDQLAADMLALLRAAPAT